MSKAQLAPLTSLRFFAALAIVLFHIKGHAGVPSVIGIALWQGVSFFFVLSGFILTYNYLDELAGARVKWNFVVKRVARLWPAHIAAIVVFLAASPSSLAHLSNWQMVALNVTMTQTWFAQDGIALSINGPSWTIATEFWFYLAFLFLIPNFDRTWPLKLGLSLVCAGAVLAVAYVLLASWPIPPERQGEATALLIVFPPARLFEFVLGMCAGLAFRRREIKRGAVATWTIAEVAAVVLVLLEMRLAFSYAGKPSVLVYWLRGSGMALPTAVLLFVFAHQRGVLSAALSFRPMIFLGEISYSIYLLHGTVSIVFFVTHLKGLIPIEFELVSYVAATLAASALVWRFIEVPLRRWITSVASWDAENRQGAEGFAPDHAGQRGIETAPVETR